jgi:hypothetical protein
LPNRDIGPLHIRAPSQQLATGFVVNGHLHNFDHVTILMAGRWLVERAIVGSNTPQAIEIEGGYSTSAILILANAWHRLTVLRGLACYMCVYPHRTEDGQISETYTGWEGAYDIPDHDRVDHNTHIARPSP